MRSRKSYGLMTAKKNKRPDRGFYKKIKLRDDEWIGLEQEWKNSVYDSLF